VVIQCLEDILFAKRLY